MKVEEQTNLTEAQLVALVDKINGRLKRLFVLPEFNDPSYKKIFAGAMPGLESYIEKTRQLTSENRPSMLDCIRSCYETPLLSKEQEFHLFRRYNYHKFLAKKWLEINRPFKACAELKKSDEVRKMISSANIRLGVNVVRKYHHNRHYDDIVGEAYFLVHRSVDYFDFTRGFKFSTYANWAVSNTMRRTIKELFDHDERYVFEAEPSSDSFACQDYQEDQQRIDHFKTLVEKLLSYLEDREREVLRMRYLEEKTLVSISKVIGVTKERVRQIELSGLKKMSLKARQLGLKAEEVW